MDKEIPDILTATNKERFRRRLSIISRILAIFLILAIIFIGFIQIKYVKEINSYRDRYGSMWSCYICGLENGRCCRCNYLPDLVQKHETFDREEFFKKIAEENILPCEIREDPKKISLDDIKDIKVVKD